jgi:hypothetical protein
VRGSARVKGGALERFDKPPAAPYLRHGMTTRETIDSVVKVLGPYIGETMARSATEAHCQKLGIADGGAVSSEQLETLLGKLGGGLNIFLGRDKSKTAIGEVRDALTRGAGR